MPCFLVESKKKKPKIKSAEPESPSKKENLSSSQEVDSLSPLHGSPPPIPPQMLDNAAVENDTSPESRRRSNGEEMRASYSCAERNEVYQYFLVLSEMLAFSHCVLTSCLVRRAQDVVQ